MDQQAGFGGGQMGQWGGQKWGDASMGGQMGSGEGRQKGTLTKWFDEKGFGFIVPENDPSSEVFVHYRSINHGQRPQGGETVEFDAQLDQQRGKMRANNVDIVGGGGGMGGGMGAMGGGMGGAMGGGMGGAMGGGMGGAMGGGMGGAMGGGMPRQFQQNNQQQQQGGWPQQQQPQGAGWGQPQQQMFGGGGKGGTGGYGF